MSSFIKFERPMLIRDAAGNYIFEHAAFAWAVEDVKAIAAIGRGEAVIRDTSASGATTIMPRWDYTTLGTDVNFAGVNVPGGTTNSPCVLAGIKVASGASVAFIGVAMENIPAGVTGHVCVDGIVAAACTTVSGTVVGSAVVGTGAGTVGGAGAVTVVPNKGLTLGNVFVLNGTTAGTTGSATQLGVKISTG